MNTVAIPKAKPESKSSRDSARPQPKMKNPNSKLEVLIEYTHLSQLLIRYSSNKEASHLLKICSKLVLEQQLKRNQRFVVVLYFDINLVSQLYHLL